MKIINTILSHYGIDRWLHLFVGALIVAQFEFLYIIWWMPLAGLCFAMFLAFLKELLDDKFDWYDIAFTFAGAMLQLFILGAKTTWFTNIPWGN